MLSNLSAEMARYGVSVMDIANALGVTDRTVRSKLAGEHEFSFYDAEKIRDKLFPTLRLEYLFRENAE